MGGELQHWIGSYSTGWLVTAQRMGSKSTTDGELQDNRWGVTAHWMGSYSTLDDELQHTGWGVKAQWIGQINAGPAEGRSRNMFGPNKSNKQQSFTLLEVFVFE